MKKILLIDAFNIIIAQNAVANITDHNAQPIGAYLTTLNQIRTFVDKFKPVKIFFVLDGPNAGERRRKLFPNYKGKRRVTARKSKVMFKDAENEESEVFEVNGAFEKQLLKIYEFLKLLPVTTCIIPYCEADDVISYIAKSNNEESESIIVSTDKDYLQLIDDNISVYNWRTKVIFNKQSFATSYNLLPVNYIFKKIVRGDSSDKIKGTKSIGEKTFAEIFHDLNTIQLKEISDFFSYLDNYNIDSLPKKHHKHITLLKESKDDLLIKFKLMKLDKDYLKLHHIEKLKQQVDEQKSKIISKLSLRILMQKDYFNKLNNGGYFNIDSWLQPFVFIKNCEINL